LVKYVVAPSIGSVLAGLFIVKYILRFLGVYFVCRRT